MRLSNIYWQEKVWLHCWREIAHHAPKSQTVNASVTKQIREKHNAERKWGRECGKKE